MFNKGCQNLLIPICWIPSEWLYNCILAMYCLNIKYI